MNAIIVGGLVHVQPDVVPVGERPDFISSNNGQGAPNIISCDGATDQINFTSLSGFWDVVIDGVLVVANTEAQDVIITVGQEFEGRLLADWDGASLIRNIDTVPHRFKFIPQDNASHEYSAAYSTPAFTVHADGHLTFCLAVPLQSECIPTSLLVFNPDSDLSGLGNYFKLSYQLDGGEIRTSFINATIGSGTGHLLEQVFTKLLRESPDHLIYWSFSGGDIYFYYDNENHVLSGRSNQDTGFVSSRLNLTFFASPNNSINPFNPQQDYVDIYPYLSDISDIEIHSCGYVQMVN